MKTIAIIGTAGVPSRYGGFETLADNLLEPLAQEYSVHVYCSSRLYTKEQRVSEYKGARLHYLPLSANGASSIVYDIISILHALFYADVLLVLGVSGCIIIPFVRLFSSKKIVVNIDGLEWRRDKWNAPIKAFLHFSEWLAVKFSHADITDNAAIQRYTAIAYKTISHLIAYGADHVSKVKPTFEDYKCYPFLHSTYAFKVARIEPENNIHLVLDAFSRMPDRTLVLVGNWNHSNYGIGLKQDYSSFSNLVLLDPIYDSHRLNLLRSNCYVYVHGHSAGGTNPSLVEAMYLKLPIVCFDVSYNRATTEDSALYFNTSKQLISVLDAAKLWKLNDIAAKMEQIAQRRYLWKVVADQYLVLCQRVLEDSKKVSVYPEFIREYKNRLGDLGMAHLQNAKQFYE